MENEIEKTLKNTIEVLKNLIKINNDRIEGYKRAENLLDNNNHVLVDFFNLFRTQSLAFKEDLIKLLADYGGILEDEKTLDGKLHHFWLKIKDQVVPPSNEEDAAFGSVVFGEKAALRAYDYAMEENQLPDGVNNLIDKQRKEISKVLKEIKDMQEDPLKENNKEEGDDK